MLILKKEKIMYNFICKECGKEFESANWNRKFCSSSCSSIFNNKARKGFKDVILVCDNCGEEFNRMKCEVKKMIKRNMKHSFCSMKCTQNFMKGQIRLNTSKAVLKAYKEGRLKPNKFKNGGIRKDIGIYVRSGWEANYARVLNYTGKKWKYEPEVFSVIIEDKEYTYRPDFYLQDEDLWIEVKGYWANKKAKQKFEEFSKHYKTLLIGEKEYTELYKKYKSKIPKWEGRKYE